MGTGEGHDSTIALPALLTISGAIPLVARQDAWQVLDETWSAAANGARQLVLVPGDAGAGKTRLLTEFARTAHKRGAAVLYGTCSEEQTVPYQPFAEALDHLVGSVDPTTIATLLGGDSSELARLTPHRAAALGVPVPAGHGDPDAERARLFRAVVEAIAGFASEQPLLLVLDDLHWARRPTVELLGHVMRDQTLRHVMILGSYRSAPAEAGDAWRTALPELRRLPGVTRLPLSPLDRDGIEDFVAAAVDQPVGPDLRAAADLLARQTDGNAFLLVELWLHLVESGYVERRGDRWAVRGRLDDVDSPEGVREAIAARLARLEAPARDLLEIASVIGATFEPSVLAAAADTTIDGALSMLDLAVRARLVGDDGAGPLPLQPRTDPPIDLRRAGQHDASTPSSRDRPGPRPRRRRRRDVRRHRSPPRRGGAARRSTGCRRSRNPCRRRSRGRRGLRRRPPPSSPRRWPLRRSGPST